MAIRFDTARARSGHGAVAALHGWQSAVTPQSRSLWLGMCLSAVALAATLVISVGLF